MRASPRSKSSAATGGFASFAISAAVFGAVAPGEPDDPGEEEEEGEAGAPDATGPVATGPAAPFVATAPGSLLFPPPQREQPTKRQSPK